MTKWEDVPAISTLLIIAGLESEVMDLSSIKLWLARLVASRRTKIVTV